MNSVRRNEIQKHLMSNFLKSVKDAASALLPKKNAASAPPAPKPDAAKKTGPDPKPTVTLLVWAAPTMNERLVVAYKPTDDPTNPNNLVSVSVRSNRHFLRYMKLQANFVEGTRYDLVGPLPRWRGRW